MASIRCPNCNLLNFDTAPECKKCREPLGTSAPEAAYAGFGANGAYHGAPQMEQAQQASSSYFEPPPPNYYNDLRGEHPTAKVGHGTGYHRTLTISIPPACVKCGSGHGVAMYDFKKDYTPPAAYFGFLLGPIPFLIILLIARKKHKMKGLFCGECWSAFRMYGTVSTLSALAGIAFLIGGLIVALSFSRPLVGLAGFILCVGIAIWGNVYGKKISPKFVKTSRQQIYIDIPGYGDTEFTHSAKV
jgi:hypothetical protein